MHVSRGSHPAESEGRDLVSVPALPAGYGGLAIPQPTAATYDTVTEGKTGWRFLFTRRWLIFVIGFVVYAIGCAAGVIWQWQLGQQITQFNAIVSANFEAPAVPLDRVLGSPAAYRASDQWRPVTATGTYLASQQVFVRDRTCGSNTGFEILTPLRLADGRLFVIDRGCVSSSSADPNRPTFTAAPPAGTVAVTARIVAGETAKGNAAPQGDQLDAIVLSQVAARTGGSVYTGAYGMLVSQAPTPARSLHRVLTGRPTIDASAQWGTIFGTALYAIVGLVIFGYALREKFRWVNRFDPRLWRRELRRIQRLARKPYSDAEIEDLLVDGYSLDTIRALGAAAASESRGEMRSLGAPPPTPREPQ
jgi:cytochrome oxidase assembly protein ShyY1